MSIHRARLYHDRKDSLVWSLSKSGVFIVKSCYDKLMGGNVLEELYPHKDLFLCLGSLVG